LACTSTPLSGKIQNTSPGVASRFAASPSRWLIIRLLENERGAPNTVRTASPSDADISTRRRIIGSGTPSCP